MVDKALFIADEMRWLEQRIELQQIHVDSLQQLGKSSAVAAGILEQMQERLAWLRGELEQVERTGTDP